MAESILWGSELSPFYLKVHAMLDHAGVEHRSLPGEGGRLENIRAAARIRQAKRRKTVLRFGGSDSLDEYPAVPFLIDADRHVHYDSTALAAWIDETHPPADGPLVPEDAAVEFVARFIDEAFDEFGLYIVHHNRWVLSAGRNDAGDRFAAELTRMFPPFMAGAISRRVAARQTRRLPYLFSVAHDDLEQDLPDDLRAPTRDGFPPTHALLDEAWFALLDAMEQILGDQPFLLGGRFTLADASAYGQLSMNLTDAPAASVLHERAPRTFAWLAAIRDGAYTHASGELVVSDVLDPLLLTIGQTFVPLMQQNERAFVDATARGESLFNETGFNRGSALYDGSIAGHPYRHVVKSFQVRTWRDLRSRWQALTLDQQTALSRQFAVFGTAFSQEAP